MFWILKLLLIYFQVKSRRRCFFRYKFRRLCLLGRQLQHRVHLQKVDFWMFVVWDPLGSIVRILFGTRATVLGGFGRNISIISNRVSISIQRKTSVVASQSRFSVNLWPGIVRSLAMGEHPAPVALPQEPSAPVQQRVHDEHARVHHKHAHNGARSVSWRAAAPPHARRRAQPVICCKTLSWRTDRTS